MIQFRKIEVATSHRTFDDVIGHRFLKMSLLFNSWKIKFFQDKEIYIISSNLSWYAITNF